MAKYIGVVTGRRILLSNADNVPVELVQNDKDTTVIDFELSKIDYVADLSQLNVAINYVNIDKDTGESVTDIYTVDKTTVEDDSLKFSWVVGSNASVYAGKCIFQLVLTLTDANDVITQQWDSTKQSIEVHASLENMNVTQPKSFVDLVTQVKKSVSDALASGITDDQIRQSVEQYLEKNPVQVITDNTLSIAGTPADALATGTAIDSLKSDLAKLESDNGIDYKQINDALTGDKTVLSDTSTNGTCYVSDGVVKSNTASGYKKMQIDVSELTDSGELVIPFDASSGNNFGIIATEKADWSNNPLVKQTYDYSTLVNNDHSSASYYHLKWNNNGDGTASLDCATIKSYIDSRPMLCFFVKNDNNQWFVPYIITDGKKKKLNWLEVSTDNLDEKLKTATKKVSVLDYMKYDGFANLFHKGICIGDSLTFGQLSGKNSTTQVHSPYPKILSKLLDTDIDVTAQCGITSKGWYDQFYQTVDFTQYDIAIIFLGTNGGLNYPVGSSATDENTIAYQSIIGGIRTQNPSCKIVIIGNVMPFYTRVLKDIAVEKGCVMLDVYHGQDMFDIRRTGSDSPTIYHPSESDWVHFSQIGYTALANIIYRMLCRSIFENHEYFEFIN